MEMFFFYANELETGIIFKLSMNDEQIQKSKTRKPLDVNKIYTLKMYIKDIFFSSAKTDKEFDVCWESLRKYLNTKIIAQQAERNKNGPNPIRSI